MPQSTPRAPAARAPTLPRMLELPRLDEALCTGCGDCPAVCPTDCLEMAGPLPWLPRPRDCVSCSLCVLICPVGALQLVPSDD
jgi:formate hydrogenlyase subunit 6/NADH:ubiquinone oxidoreductase subunit I